MGCPPHPPPPCGRRAVAYGSATSSWPSPTARGRRCRWTTSPSGRCWRGRRVKCPVTGKLFSRRAHDSGASGCWIYRCVVCGAPLPSIRTGDQIPLDGTVTHGHMSVDESVLTGEAKPVVKGKGSRAFAHGGRPACNGRSRGRVTHICHPDEPPLIGSKWG